MQAVVFNYLQQALRQACAWFSGGEVYEWLERDIFQHWSLFFVQRSCKDTNSVTSGESAQSVAKVRV